MSSALPTDDDIDRMMTIMGSAFEPAYGEAWTRRQLSDALLLRHCHYALLDADGNPPGAGEVAAGFTLSRHIFEDEELLLIAVHPDARRKGIGRKLLDHLTCEARERGATRLFLEMRDGNPAEKLYLAMGFAPTGRRRDYYRDGRGGMIDAISFARILRVAEQPHP